MKILGSTLCIALLFTASYVSAQQPGNGFDWYTQGKTVHFFPQDETGTKYEWTFGDVFGGTSSAVTPTYTYLAADGEYEVTLTITDSNGIDTTYIDTVGTGTYDNSTLPGTTSITEQSQKTVQLYPNPASDFVQILLPNAHSNTTIHLYDISGKQLMEQNPNLSENLRFNTRSLPEGIYFMEIRNAEGVEVRKLQVKR